MTQLIGYIPSNWTKERLDPNTILIKRPGATICAIEHPHQDEIAEIHADLIAAIPQMLRALRSIESLAENNRPGRSQPTLDQIKHWATEALAAANWKE